MTVMLRRCPAQRPRVRVQAESLYSSRKGVTYTRLSVNYSISGPAATLVSDGRFVRWLSLLGGGRWFESRMWHI